ncbi:hypothetical protein EIP86_010599, partial [Pleurotus ostreatoroseus]
EYLDLSPRRPRWTYIADVLIGEQVVRSCGNIRSHAKLKICFQIWRARTHGTSSLQPDSLRILRTAARYSVEFAAIKLSTRLKRQLPAWYHFGA